MSHDVQPLREILIERMEIFAFVGEDAAEVADEAIAGVRRWLEQPGIVAVLHEGYLESGVQMMTGAQRALVREAGDVGD